MKYNIINILCYEFKLTIIENEEGCHLFISMRESYEMPERMRVL